MAKIIAGLFTSVDGVISDPQDWHFPYFDDEVGAVVGSLTQPRMLLGRVTYAGFAEHFAPLAGQEFADQMAAPPKFVVSSTLESAEWGNATVLGADWVERLREIKAGDGADLGMSGSVALIRGLIGEGLLDELHLLVHPVVVGKGDRLFPEGSGSFPLPLKSATTLGNGTLHVVYAPETR
ncbi:dihydrofolate reductase family protein [Pseudonocardia oroxyli]|uniref:Dihydrofolate reductase n=1 Tax=Pseudonocardia oroxyli TaxID=366584 RepID=A0A1G7UJ08_PSEOR|nr:dihydrofolate reductase family protein [Pseudonocardia oroxyli]SDG47542.1 Dihydrofolate reductase [Pseudonocardia oroxyli]